MRWPCREAALARAAGQPPAVDVRSMMASSSSDEEERPPRPRQQARPSVSAVEPEPEPEPEPELPVTVDDGLPLRSATVEAAAGMARDFGGAADSETADRFRAVSEAANDRAVSEGRSRLTPSGLHALGREQSPPQREFQGEQEGAGSGEDAAKFLEVRKAAAVAAAAAAVAAAAVTVDTAAPSGGLRFEAVDALVLSLTESLAGVALPPAATQVLRALVQQTEAAMLLAGTHTSNPTGSQGCF